MSWATEQDVTALTGVPVAEDELARAQATIELSIGRFEETAAGEISARDLEWLKRAISYQAAWEKGQADLHTRIGVTQLSQDGMAATFPGDALVLAPLAKSALARLSWRGGVRSIEVAPHQAYVRLRYPGGTVVDYPREEWQPL